MLCFLSGRHVRRICLQSREDRNRTISSSDYRTNSQIRANKVRLIDDNEDNLGVVPINEALDKAEEAGLDLVEVAPNANPPVCRIMDFGKFQYEKQKRERKARKQQKTIQVKEIQLRPKTDDHHLSFRLKDARRWIEDGMKVRVKMRFRGREITHPEIGRERLDGIIEEMKDVAIVEQRPNLEGYNMTMILAPNPDNK